jgi:SAM-dependent methyltransferase
VDSTLAPLKDAVSAFPRRYCPVCESLVDRRFGPGPNGRPNARCPRCGSLERHRFFAVLMTILEPLLADVDTVLDVAPSPQTTPRLQALGAKRFVRIDLGYDGRPVDVLGSLTQLPHPAGSIDFLFCSNVLEHIPDDKAAISEIARVLAPSGLGLLQVPYRDDSLTDEDPDAPEEERIRRFGQADHVRWYGTDFDDRLAAGGLSIQRITPRALLGDAMCEWLVLAPEERTWLVRPTADASVPPPLVAVDTSLTRTFDAMLQVMTRQRARLVAGKAERAELRERLDRAPATRARRAARRLATRLGRRSS